MRYLVLCAPIYDSIQIEDKTFKTKFEAVNYLRKEMSLIVNRSGGRFVAVYTPHSETTDYMCVVYDAHLVSPKDGIVALMSIYAYGERRQFKD